MDIRLEKEQIYKDGAFLDDNLTVTIKTKRYETIKCVFTDGFMVKKKCIYRDDVYITYTHYSKELIK